MDLGLCTEWNNDRRGSEDRGLKEAEFWMVPQVISSRALEQISPLWSKGSVSKFVILKTVSCRSRGSPYSSKIRSN